jgi:hypothetical protein
MKVKRVNFRDPAYFDNKAETSYNLGTEVARLWDATADLETRLVTFTHTIKQTEFFIPFENCSNIEVIKEKTEALTKASVNGGTAKK